MQAQPSSTSIARTTTTGSTMEAITSATIHASLRFTSTSPTRAACPAGSIASPATPQTSASPATPPTAISPTTHAYPSPAPTKPTLASRPTAPPAATPASARRPTALPAPPTELSSSPTSLASPAVRCSMAAGSAPNPTASLA